ncbi:hypothetical protein [Candidatus Poriferisodalis sp.]|uniref:hypothetical protein n=1 Tax=Candidatus Poriferisodalis sp. TaxID=3101277 RepID=UPI003B029C1F
MARWSRLASSSPRSTSDMDRGGYSLSWSLGRRAADMRTVCPIPAAAAAIQRKAALEGRVCAAYQAAQVIAEATTPTPQLLPGPEDPWS